MASSSADSSTSAALLPKEYWQHVWGGARLPRTVRPGAIPDLDALFKRFLPSRGEPVRLLEAGCAPGRWLHYFAKQFGYQVTGLEYVSQACGLTRQNLAMLDTPAEIVNADLFDYVPEKGPFDVVISVGLVEHFVDLEAVVRRLAELARPDGGLIVTVVPNLHGVEGWMLKRIRPRVYAGHVRISLEQLTAVHESSGVQTLFSDYAGGCFLPPPLRGTEFARKHPTAALLVNLPVIALNRALKCVEVAANKFPRGRLWSPKLMYVGRRSVSPTSDKAPSPA
jgi:SAM-dependent methyltransferase